MSRYAEGGSIPVQSAEEAAKSEDRMFRFESCGSGFRFVEVERPDYRKLLRSMQRRASK